ncbi:MAG: Na(+)-translocating NADH-quinone reductase subunit C [Pseudomonadales bacterium]|nr:Na(+)-translocating NADH-quinone reductase subunit C [Pseudomonadales bacterium]
MFNKDSLNTLIVAFVLCLVCSILVSTLAVGLKPLQDANKLLDRNKNILAAADMLEDGASAEEVEAAFAQFTLKLVNLKTGKFATDAELAAAGINTENYNQGAAAKSATAIVVEGAPPGLTRIAAFATVYALEKNGVTDLLVLPVRGPGLWGAMYGFLVLEADINTIKGLAYYSHKETPGLGAKVDTEKWKALWPGKAAYTASGDINIVVGNKNGNINGAGFIDGLSGATLTTAGVHNTIQFWLGTHGYANFLKNLKAGEA